MSNETNEYAGPSCDVAREALIELGPDEEKRAQIATAIVHLNACTACREAMRDFDRMQLALRGVTDHSEHGEPTGSWEAYERRLQRTARRSSSSDRTRTRWLRPLGGIAAGVLLAVGGFL